MFTVSVATDENLGHSAWLEAKDQVWSPGGLGLSPSSATNSLHGLGQVILLFWDSAANKPSWKCFVI